MLYPTQLCVRSPRTAAGGLTICISSATYICMFRDTLHWSEELTKLTVPGLTNQMMMMAVAAALHCWHGAKAKAAFLFVCIHFWFS
jgi:hypothetical protein